MRKEPEYIRALRWLDKRHRSRRVLAKRLPFDTNADTLYSVLSRQSEMSEERQEQVIRYQENLSTTVQRTISALGAAMQADLPENVHSVIQEEHSKLCDTH